MFATIRTARGGRFPAAFACLLIAGCASNTTGPGQTVGSGHTAGSGSAADEGPQFLGPVSAQASYGSGAIVLDPPGRATPGLTWTQAIAYCGDQGCSSSPVREVLLALATTPRSGTAQSDGSIAPMEDHVLSYVLISDRQTCFPAGVIPGSQPTPSACTMIQLIDANTGAAGFSVSTSG